MLYTGKDNISMDVYTLPSQATINKNHNNAIQTVLWRDVRDTIYVTNPDLAKIIDDIDPPDSFRLYKINYNYGDPIVHKGNFMLPNSRGELKDINSKDTLPHIYEDLGYNYGANPLCLILKNTVEFYLDLGHRTAPMMLSGAGSALGMWAALSHKVEHQPPFLWDICAGARSIFMLPKISDKISHNRMTKALNISVEKPKNLMDHWQVFNAISKNKEATTPWQCELIAFSKPWIEHFSDPAWQRLHYHFLQATWDGTKYFRNIYIWNTVFSYIVERRKLPPNPYLHDTVRHLFGISVGGIPGFAPLIDNALGPISDIQKVYDEIYRLKEAAPIIMGPVNLDRDSLDPVYYSLNFPTSTISSPKNRSKANLINEANEFNDLLRKYLSELGNKSYNLEPSLLSSVVKSTYFKMIHSNTYNDQIIPSTSIPSFDNRFATISKNFSQQSFPETSSFWNGAVAIISKDTK